MTFEERADRLAVYGFTPRQAGFLTTVMLHAGVCVQRQYAQFARIANGQITRDFFARLVRERHASSYPCWRGAGRIYHVQHKGLYRAIGEPDNRHRRRVIVARAVERLMVLDAVLAAPDITWLATEQDKIALFVHRLQIDPADLPKLTFTTAGRDTVRWFPAKLPIGVSGADVVLLFTAFESDAAPFRRFLDSHRSLLERLGRGRIRVVAPRSRPAVGVTYGQACEAFFAAPIRPGVLAEFQWYCQARRSIERTPEGDRIDRARFDASRRAFGSDRFFTVYRDWLRHGDVALNALLSTRLHDAWRRADLRVEFQALPYEYEHLSPSLAIA